MRSLHSGDHLRVYRFGYSHHAIYAGSGRVIHFSGGRDAKAEASIQAGTLAEFALGAEIQVVEYSNPSPPEQVLARARSRLGERGYHAAWNNCEHFARWCKTGESTSEQVRGATAVATGAAGSAAATAATIGTVAASGAALGLSGPGVMSGLASLGGAAGAAGGVAAAAAAPALLATVAVRHAFRDDAVLSLDERAARQGARSAAPVAAVGGVVGALGLVSAIGVPGLSAVGMTTGLAGLGGLVGGGMVAGVCVAAALPAVAVGAVALGAHRFLRMRARKRALRNGHDLPR